MYRYIKYRIVFLICQVLISSHIYCQESLSFKHFSVKDGLSESSVISIYQDNLGLIWIGTFDGLNMFDGYSFTTYRYDQNNHHSLSHNTVYFITEDSFGNIWVGTEQALDMFDRDKLHFVHHHIQHDTALNKFSFVPERTGFLVNYFKKDSQGNFWINSEHHRILLYCNIKNNTIKSFNLNDLPRIGSNVYSIKSVEEISDGSIWFGTDFNGILIYDPIQESFTHLYHDPSDPMSLSHNFVLSIYQDNDQNIWCGTYGGGLNLYDPETGSFKHKKQDGEDPNSLHSNFIHTILEDSKGRLLIGTDGGGLNILKHFDNNDFQHIIYSEYNSASLSNNAVRIIYEDMQNNLWIGNFRGGLNLSKDRTKKAFINIKHEIGNINSLIYNRVTSICEDPQGNLWIGTDGSGMDFYNRNEHVFTHFKHQPENANSIPGNAILCLLIPDTNSVWMGSYLGGLSHLDRSKNKFTNYRFTGYGENNLSGNDVRCIKNDEYGNIWIGTNGGGVFIYNPLLNKFDNYQQSFGEADLSEKLTNSWITTLFIDKKNIGWIGSYWGLTRIDYQRKKVYRFFTQVGEQKELTSNVIYSINQSDDSTFWIGTSEGLNKVIQKNDSTLYVERSFTEKDGLPNDNIIGILIDENGYLWMSTNNGLSRFDPITNKFRNYDFRDGIQSNSFVINSYTKSRDGKLYFGGIDGITGFYPDQIMDDTTKPTVLLTDLKLNNSSIPIGETEDGRVILTESIMKTSEIELNHNDKVITIEFVAIHFQSPEKNQYRYMLEGFDNSWNEVSSNIRFANYTNLEPGTYKFRVIASNADGIWNQEGVTLSILIKPPVWMTWWFRLLVILILILSISGIYYLRLRTIRYRNVILQKLVSERTSEIQEKNKILKKQTAQLNNKNKLLKEGRSKIVDQAKELLIQKGQLEVYNKQLLDTNEKLEERRLKIEQQSAVVTDQKKKLENVNQELKELIATKDKFFSIIAHDLKNPFNVFLGFSELLCENFDNWEDDYKKRIINNLYETAVNLYDFLETLLKWAMTQQNKIKYIPERLVLPDIIKNNIELLNDMVQNKKIRIDNEITNNNLLINADLNMLNTVVRNILTNAIKFTRNGGKIGINSRIENGHCLITISDNGVGISESDQHKLFKLDENFSTEGTNAEKGTGLGLILCKEFITKHNGSIHVSSTPGKGTDVTFSVPTYS